MICEKNWPIFLLLLAVPICGGGIERLVSYQGFIKNSDLIDIQELPLQAVYDRYDKTVTQIGGNLLRDRRISTDLNMVNAQSAAISALCSNSDARMKIRDLLKESDLGMNELLKYADGADEYNRITKRFYLPEWHYFFPKFFNYLNTNERILNSAATFSIARNIVNVINLLAISGLITEGLTAFRYTTKFNCWSALKTGPLAVVMRHLPYRMIDDNELFSGRSVIRNSGLTFAERVVALSAVSYSVATGITIEPESRTLFKAGVATVLVGAYTAWLDYTEFSRIGRSVSLINNGWKSIGTVRLALNKIARLIALSYEIRNTLKSLSLATHVRLFDSSLDMLCHNAQELYNQLQTETFVGDGDFYSRGRVLVAHRNLLKMWKDFIPLCMALGEIDALASWAEQLSHDSAHWAIPKSSDTEFSIEELWHPTLPAFEAVKNDWVGDQLTVITGPNGSGKTTALESVALAVALYQTWGIVPARSATMPIFSDIITNLHVMGSIVEGKSKFMVQIEQLNALFNRIMSYSGTLKKVLVVIDEPLSGTIQATAGPRIAQFCYDCLNCPELVMILATHCFEPTTVTGVRLIHPEIIEGFNEQHGIFFRTFKIKPGIAAWWFNDALQRDRFIAWLERMEMHI